MLRQLLVAVVVAVAVVLVAAVAVFVESASTVAVVMVKVVVEVLVVVALSAPPHVGFILGSPEQTYVTVLRWFVTGFTSSFKYWVKCREQIALLGWCC